LSGADQGNPRINHQHRKTLASIFAHPLPHNLDPKAVEHLLAELGAEVVHAEHGMTQVTLLGQHGSFHFNLHAVVADDVMKLRHLLTAAGLEPGAFPG
jgi:hypothetical protein